MGVLILYTETNRMDSTSREIRRLNIKSLFSRGCLWRCYRCYLTAFCYLLYLGSERLPALSTICLFGCLACVWRFLCRLSFIQLLLFEQDTSVFYLNLPLKFRNVLQLTESRSFFACNQNIKEDIPTELEVLLCFKTKRNET